MSALRTLPSLLLALSVGCEISSGGGDSGRMHLALSGQFLDGELTTLDIDVYDGEVVSCQGGVRVEGDTALGRVDGQAGLSLPADPVSISLDAGRYVVRVRAGAADDMGPGGTPLAEGCATVTLAAGQEQDLAVPLRRADRCGDGVLDMVEMCDDGNGDAGDDCDGHCRTEPAWLNAVPSTAARGNQSMPRAAGDRNLAVVCWRSADGSNDEGPVLFLDRFGEPTDELFFQTTGTRVDCADVDVVAGAVLVVDMWGEAAARWSMIAMWDPAETYYAPFEVGSPSDFDVAAAFLDPMRAVVAIEGGPLDEDLRYVSVRIVTVTGGAIQHEGGEVRVDDSETGQRFPAVAAGSDGQFLVAWQDDIGRTVARLFDGPSAGGPVLNLYEGTGLCGPPAVARLDVGGEARYAVVWKDGEFDRIVGRIVSASGAVSEQFFISEEAQSVDPDVAAHDEEFVVVWTQPGPTDTDVFARALVGVDESGEPVFGYLATGNAVTSEPLQVNPTSTGIQGQPSIAAGSNTEEGTAVIVYRDSQGNGDDIARRVIRVVRPPAG